MEDKQEETVKNEADACEAVDGSAFDNNWRYVASMVSIIFFLVSFDADVILAYEYHRRQMHHAFNATAAVLVTSGVVIGCLSTAWSILNESWTRYRPLYFVCLLTRFPIAGFAR